MRNEMIDWNTPASRWVAPFQVCNCNPTHSNQLNCQIPHHLSRYGHSRWNNVSYGPLTFWQVAWDGKVGERRGPAIGRILSGAYPTILDLKAFPFSVAVRWLEAVGYLIANNITYIRIILLLTFAKVNICSRLLPLPLQTNSGYTPNEIHALS